MECLANSCIEILAGWLPGPWVFRLGASLGSLAWHVLPARRRIVMRNLRIAFAGEMNPAEIEKLARASFRRTGANLFSVAHTARIPTDELGEVFHFRNPELLEQALGQGRGLVILLSHMGNWELLSRIGRFFPKGTPTGAFYRPLNNPILDQRVLDRRQADGTRMFSKGDNPLHVAALLREGGAVGILADQRVGPKGDLVGFFGRLTRASPLPSLLARRTKSPVVALSLTTIAPGKWQGEIIPVADPPNTANCMLALEQAMRANAEDVFWFQDRWKVYVRPDLPICEWLGAASPRSGKPHRVLLWLADAPASWQVPEPWLHPDVTYEVVNRAGSETPPWIPGPPIVHALPGDTSPRALARRIREIDDASPLPLDVILACKPPAALKAIAKKDSIRLVCFPE